LWKLFNDIEDPDSDLVLTVTGNSNTKLFSGVNIDPATGKLILDSAADAFGHGVITVRATDTGGQSIATTIDITINNVNDAPIVSATAGNVVYTGAGVVVDPTLDISDVDSTTLTGATVRIANFAAEQDVLSFTSNHGITGSYDASTGVLTLSGAGSIAQYRDVLRSVTYSSPESAARGPRQIE